MIKGLKKSSFVDYPKKVSYVIFMGGCNMRCPFCHNKSIVNNETDDISIETILDDLEERRGFIETVTITGGEPTIYGDKLIELILKIKELGYLIKLDTNGTNPKILKRIISEELVDYIAMDIKNTFERYNETTNAKIDTNDIKKSIQLIEAGKIDYEFRTTVNKEMHPEEAILELTSYVTGNNKLILQPYKYSKEQIKDIKYTPYTEEELLKIKEKYKVSIRV